MKKTKRTAAEIAISAWMAANADRFIDRRTGEFDCTGAVEAWDQERGDGSTTDPEHYAWTAAALHAEKVEAVNQGLRARRAGGAS